MLKITCRILFCCVLLFFFSPSFSQSATDSLILNASLQTCIEYAVKHYPQIQQSQLDEQITEHQIKSKLSAWYPQINFSGIYQSNFQPPTALFNGNYVKVAPFNTSTIGLGGTQNIFTRDLLLASKSAKDVRKQVRQTTILNKIDLVANVSKAFYDVLLTQKQIDLLDEDIVRLERSHKDAYNQYQGGIVDKTDYKRALIALNNSKAQKKAEEELLKAKIANLKLQMGYTWENEITLLYDSVQMEKEALIDTNQIVDYNKRIEFQQLLTQKRLQEENLEYNKWSLLPTVSLFANYNLLYLSNQFSSLYNQSFPNSYGGLQLSLPIFQGTKRIHDIRTAKLEVSRADWDIVAAKNNINTQYASAMAAYKSYLNDYYVMRANVELAKEVYQTLELQYKAGIKTYLDVITAETDLRNAQSNYTNALYQVLRSKVDVQKALGNIQY
ncbi:MAG: TolC family protein [Bacteroidetes bacterium]|nr:TolC family protein [Bacteroidota bacterium]